MPNETRKALTGPRTGSSSGIGMAIAGYLLRQGWSRRGCGLAAAVVADDGFVPVTVDLTDRARSVSAPRLPSISPHVEALKVVAPVACMLPGQIVAN